MGRQQRWQQRGLKQSPPTGLLNILTAKFGTENVFSRTSSVVIQRAVCEKPDEFVYWDPFHPVARVHAMVAGSLRGLLVGEAGRAGYN